MTNLAQAYIKTKRILISSADSLNTELINDMNYITRNFTKDYSSYILYHKRILKIIKYIKDKLDIEYLYIQYINFKPHPFFEKESYTKDQYPEYVKVVKQDIVLIN